jgi:nucleoside phosphorylase
MPLIYVFASSKIEARPVLALAGRGGFGKKARAPTVEVGANRFILIITGMGTGNARIRADAALGLAAPGAASERRTEMKPDAILAIGLCGGLTKARRKERIVAYSECLSAEELPPLRCSTALTGAIIDILQKDRIACDRVIGITSPRIASTKSERLSLARLGASVVDMETYQLLSAATRAGVPAAVLRVVGDPLDAKIPDFNSALDASGGLIASKAIWIALRSPLETFRLLAASKRAMERLAPAVKLVLQSTCFSNLTSATTP